MIKKIIFTLALISTLSACDEYEQKKADFYSCLESGLSASECRAGVFGN